ncbi:lysozyme inhibitor LprI family protein [Oceanobacillus sp. AG]|uniref:lysozyme inhibitor LprI family protein n=1 Tax=Oceanobacillus sp. AG TaxID=2681969 RepID=UPI0012EB61BE|nr:lysozyme inhibitor LprI family protein [Oceanobacillus sp. AG]
MKKRNFLIAASLLVILLVGMSACSSNSSDDDITSTKNQSNSESTPQSKDDSSQSNDSHSESTQAEDNQKQADNTEDTTSANTTSESQEEKVEGRRAEFLERLDNIQKELDALPEKEHADKGVTNAMKNYYGRAYEMYDEELNEIYALLKKELSPETMEDLKAEQIQWIDQKEDKANKERLEYEGGTFENVALYMSLYESTKDRSYELVNKYMTD